MAGWQDQHADHCAASGIAVVHTMRTARPGRVAWDGRCRLAHGRGAFRMTPKGVLVTPRGPGLALPPRVGAGCAAERPRSTNCQCSSASWIFSRGVAGSARARTFPPDQRGPGVQRGALKVVPELWRRRVRLRTPQCRVGITSARAKSREMNPVATPRNSTAARSVSPLMQVSQVAPAPHEQAPQRLADAELRCGVSVPQGRAKQLGPNPLRVAGLVAVSAWFRG